MRAESFPKEFVWGAASSSYQIEGGADPELRGESVWDAFCERSGTIRDASNGRTACDHYHRYRDDVLLMQSIGLQAYRFSVSWPRLLPAGTGNVNAAGLDFYDRLVDALLAANITPWLTLYHWDMPLVLDGRGGWGNRDSADWFAEYTGVVASRLGDRVRHWMTLNEPQIFLGLGLGDGTHAPGRKLPMAERLQAAHHALLAHGDAVRVLRSILPRDSQIGWAPAVRVEYPATDRPVDIQAARQATLSVRNHDLWNNTWFADPICLGQYPEDGWKFYSSDVPRVSDGDLKRIAQPLDFFGVNIYSGSPTRANEDGTPVVMGHPVGHPRSALNWPVAAPSLRWGPRFLWERYRLPIVVTENGMSNLDWVNLDGKVNDPQRIDYTRRYLIELRKAVADGVDVRGYFHWAIMDNFEWAEGYKDRFGLVHVDFQTQVRTLKASAHWYRSLIAGNGAALDTPVEGMMTQRLSKDGLTTESDPVDAAARVRS